MNSAPRFIRPIATRLAASGAALAMTALGCAAAAAAPLPARAPAAPAGVTWHKLTLHFGWQSAQADVHTGDPSWAVRNGIVYLSGSMHHPGGPASGYITTLPRAARPGRALIMLVYTNSGAYGQFDILRSGAIYVASSTLAGAAAFTSLAGLSFPAAATGLHRLTLLHGWAPAPRNADAGSPSYLVRDGVAYLSGGLHQPSGSGNEFAVLPRGARPASRLYLSVYTSGGTAGVLRIYPSGKMFAYGAAAKSFTALAAVSYPVAGASRHPLGLINGWQSSQSQYLTGDPSYRVSGGVAYLSGSLWQSSGTDPEFARLPAAARPKHPLFIKVYTFEGTVGSIKISPDGYLFGYSPDQASAQSYTSLAGISYPLSS